MPGKLTWRDTFGTRRLRSRALRSAHRHALRIPLPRVSRKALRPREQTMLALVGTETRLAASLARGTSRRTKKRTPERRTVRGDLSVRASQTRWTLDGADCPRAESGEILDESKSSQCPVRPIDITDYCEVRVGETSLMRGGSRVFCFLSLTLRRPRPLASRPPLFSRFRNAFDGFVKNARMTPAHGNRSVSRPHARPDRPTTVTVSRCWTPSSRRRATTFS